MADVRGFPPNGWLRHQLNAANTNIKPGSVKDKLETQGMKNQKIYGKITNVEDIHGF